jgi:hypothetical protein
MSGLKDVITKSLMIDLSSSVVLDGLIHGQKSHHYLYIWDCENPLPLVVGIYGGSEVERLRCRLERG